MVGGQAIDLEAAGQAHAEGAPEARLSLDADGLREMHARKTGALIRAAAAAGAVMAGAPEPLVQAVTRYATELGLAFQIVDDILDVEGAAANLGKTAGKDAAAGKPTYVSLFGVGQARRLAQDALARALAALEPLPEGRRLAGIARWVVERSA
jgi:geranylgeranyl pyrophosphate synthase